MKATYKFSLEILSLIFLTCFVSLGNKIDAQESKKPLKIGTFDSRIVVLAYSRSDLFNERMNQMRETGEEIMQSNDTAKKIENAYKMFTWQYLLHQMVFCSGSTAAILDLVKDKLPQVAKEAGVSVITSKWELTFADPSAEIFDLTMPVAKLFNPKENIEAMAKDLTKQAPIPLSDFTVEEVIQMWKQFESKYLGKK
jgi:hypothetical protein